MWDTTVQRWQQEFREEGLRAGEKTGEKKGEVRLLLRQLESKFGPLDARTRARVRRAGSERLLTWADRVLTAERLEQVFEA